MPFDDELEPIDQIDDLPIKNFDEDKEGGLPPEKPKKKDVKKDSDSEENYSPREQTQSFGKIVTEIKQLGEKTLSGIEDLDFQLIALDLLIKKYKIAIENLKENTNHIKSENAKKLEQGIEILRQAKKEIKGDMENFLSEIEGTFTSIIKEEVTDESKMQNLKNDIKGQEFTEQLRD